MHTVQAVIFDLDGTLADTLASIASFANCGLRSCGLPVIETNDYRYLVGNGRDVLIRRMVERTHGCFDAGLFDRVGAAYDAAYAADPMHLVAPYPHIPELLAGLQERNLPCAVFSNKPDDMTHAVVSGLFAPDAFRVVRGQMAAVPKKPAPDGVLAILETLGVSPKNCLYVGDTKTDMETGRNAGAIVAGVLWGFRDRAELAAYSPDIIVGDPLELLDFIDARA